MNPLIKQIIYFILSGLGAYGIRVVLLYVFMTLLLIPFWIAYAIILGVIIIYGFIVNIKLIFKNKEELGNKFKWFAIAIIVFSVVDWGLAQVVAQFLPVIPYVIIVFFSAGFSMVLKFLIYKYIIFVDKKSLPL